MIFFAYNGSLLAWLGSSGPSTNNQEPGGLSGPVGATLSQLRNLEAQSTKTSGANSRPSNLHAHDPGSDTRLITTCSKFLFMEIKSSNAARRVCMYLSS